VSPALPLSENLDLAFRGERAWTPARLTAAEAARLRDTPNRSARDNAEVLRRYVGGSTRRLRYHWQIDFPTHFYEQEVALYADPAELLYQRLSPSAELSASAWWLNPHANAALRIAIARCDRYLVATKPTAKDAPPPEWVWVESEFLPDDSLLAIARDDDFTHGVLQSREFATWWQTHFTPDAPTVAITSFPFPWAPATPFSALSARQQELRADLIRATRQAQPEAIAHAVSTAYGWSNELPDADLIDRLTALYSHRLH
jgi:hypothetical protein